MNEKAIVVYLDDSDRIETELSWLHKTWILHGLDRELDLVIYHHPDAGARVARFQDRDGVHAVPMAPRDCALDYPFLNSIRPYLEPFAEPLGRYRALLKTDCDVFLTHHLRAAGYDPIRFGEGGYCQPGDPTHRAAMTRLCEHHGFAYRGIANVGASCFGPRSEVLRFASLQAGYTEFLLSEESDSVFWQAYGGPRRNVSSMFAGEMAVNRLYESGAFEADSLDSPCTNRPLDASVLHIHAWHTPAFWSKHQFFQGRYDALRVDLLDAFERAGSYCHWVATTPLSRIEQTRDLIQRLAG